MNYEILFMNQYRNPNLLWGKVIDASIDSNHLQTNKPIHDTNTLTHCRNENSCARSLVSGQNINELEVKQHSEVTNNKQTYEASKIISEQKIAQRTEPQEKQIIYIIKQQLATEEPNSYSNRISLSPSDGSGEYAPGLTSLRRRSEKSRKIRNENNYRKYSTSETSINKKSETIRQRKSGSGVCLQPLNDEQLLESLGLNHGSGSRWRQTAQTMTRKKSQKQDEINVLSVHRDQLKLIKYLNSINNSTHYHSNANKSRIRLSTLKYKSQCLQSLQQKQQFLQQALQFSEQESDLLSQYMIHLTQTIEYNNPTNLNLEYEQELMSKNMNHELDYLIRQLKLLRSNNMKESIRVNRDIMELRIAIKKKEDRLKTINCKIFEKYIRKNKKINIPEKQLRGTVGSKKAGKQIIRVIISSVLEQQMVFEETDPCIINQNSQSFENMNAHRLKSLSFYLPSSQTLYIQQFDCEYMKPTSKLQTAVGFDRNEKISIPITQKLKSLTFYFDNQIVIGLQAKYASITHSYDIGRQNQMMAVGQCSDNLQKFQFSCKNKHIITIGSLRHKTKSKNLAGFVIYFIKKDSESTQVFLPRMHRIKTSKNSSEKSRNSSCERISINSKKQEQPQNPYEVGQNKHYRDKEQTLELKRQKETIKKYRYMDNQREKQIDRNGRNKERKIQNKRKGGEATTQYCLINS